jgi:polyphosphate:AMP phosphotransferase
MLEKLDLTRTVDDKTFNESLAGYKERLSVLQRMLRDQKIPAIIVIEGWNASGITMSTQAIIQSLDPRGFTLHSIDRPTEEEQMRPFLWRFWIRTPSRGRIALFARSWYTRALSEEMQKPAWKKSLAKKIRSINNFERQLSDDGTVIVKLFLHISREEQKNRLEERERNPLTAWLVTPSIWHVHHHYDESLPVIDDFIEETSTGYAPWNVIEATDRKYTILKVYSTLVKNLEKAIEGAKEEKSKKGKLKDPAKPKKSPVKRSSTPEETRSKEDYQQTLASLQIEMLEMHYLLFKRKIPLIILYEGWDAAGKGGTITRVARYMNPLEYDVFSTAAPDPGEKEHHYLWRFIRQYPKAGHVAIYDRSWYGRVLVERVEGFCSDAEWQRAYQEINEMEEEYITSSGGAMVKFWMEVSKDEQLRRFQQRASDPLKIHKITDEDWRNREKWDLYDEAIDEMLARTSTSIAPWTVIESDDKWYARVKALTTIIDCTRELL